MNGSATSPESVINARVAALVPDRQPSWRRRRAQYSNVGRRASCAKNTTGVRSLRRIAGE